VPLRLSWLLKSEKVESPRIDKIPAEVIKAGGKTICCEIHNLLFLSGMRRNCLRSGRSQSLSLTIIVDYQCGFQCNRSTADHMFCIHQILEKKWEYNEAVYQLFKDFKKAYDSVRREVLCNIHIVFGIPMKLVRLIKMCLN